MSESDSRAFMPLLACAALSFALIGGTLAINAFTGMPFSSLVRDPASTMEFPPYVGFLSHAGGLLWVAAAAVGLFVASVLPRNSEARGFLFLAGGIALVFGLDDVYMFHDYLAPRVIGIPEKIVYLLYAATVLFLIRLGRGLPDKRGYPLFLIALSAMGLSVMVDVLDSRGWFPLDGPYLLEDSLKIIGVVFWLGYLVVLSTSALTSLRSLDARR